MSEPTLYERLGGIYPIATFVDDAHHKVSPAGFKYLVTEMVGWATGGPQVYTGKSMLDSHQHLKISPHEWEAFIDDLRQSCDRFQIPSRERSELIAIVQSTYNDIVHKSHHS